jgi:hypothetical protein
MQTFFLVVLLIYRSKRVCMIKTVSPYIIYSEEIAAHGRSGNVGDLLIVVLHGGDVRGGGETIRWEMCIGCSDSRELDLSVLDCESSLN